MPVPKLQRLTINGETLHLDYLLTTEFDNVAEALELLPSAISWLNWHRADAIEAMLLAARQRDECEAVAYFELRNGAFEEKGYGGKVTDVACKTAVLLDESVQEASYKWELAKGQVERIQGQLEALEAKLDLVRTHEATRRRLQSPVPTDDELEAMTREKEQNE